MVWTHEESKLLGFSSYKEGSTLGPGEEKHEAAGRADGKSLEGTGEIVDKTREWQAAGELEVGWGNKWLRLVLTRR